MNLKEFAQQYLQPESTSTNPGHKKVLAYTALNEHRFADMTLEEYNVLHTFIDRDFDFGVFDNPPQEIDNEAYLSFTFRKPNVKSTPIPEKIQQRITESIRKSGIIPD